MDTDVLAPREIMAMALQGLAGAESLVTALSLGYRGPFVEQRHGWDDASSDALHFVRGCGK
jgi:hypothetical protein